MTFALIHVALLALADPPVSVPLAPVDVMQFWVQANCPAMIHWQAERQIEVLPREALTCVVRDYGGRQVEAVRLEPAGQRRLATTLVRPPGFYELELPGGERFGLVCLAPASGPRDPFFCIDAAISWLVPPGELRRGLVHALRRGGVAMARERVNWAHVEPAAGQWDGDGQLGYESLRRLYAAQDVPVLEMFHNAPPWTGLVGKYPENLPLVTGSWRKLAGRWHSTWGALEVWNEPDIHFGANLPADQYVAVARSMRFALDQAEMKLPLVTGVFARYHERFLDVAAQNGLLQLSDAVSFHTYDRAMAMQELVGRYRRWLAANGEPAMPLWITECGRPWGRGPDRPPVEQDARSALDIVMKAVEARACGAARYFAFVYPFYEENTNNFGMMGREGTPLRSVAAYVQCIRALGGKDYLGDLALDDPAVLRARVFGDRHETVAVIYTGQVQAEATVGCDLPVLRVEGIDGRELSVQPAGRLPVPDGLVFVWFGQDAAQGRLRSDTMAMELWRQARDIAPPRPRAVSPVVRLRRVIGFARRCPSALSCACGSTTCRRSPWLPRSGWKWPRRRILHRAKRKRSGCRRKAQRMCIGAWRWARCWPASAKRASPCRPQAAGTSQRRCWCSIWRPRVPGNRNQRQSSERRVLEPPRARAWMAGGRVLLLRLPSGAGGCTLQSEGRIGAGPAPG